MIHMARLISIIGKMSPSDFVSQTPKINGFGCEVEVTYRIYEESF